MLASLAKLKDLVDRPVHAYRAGTATFVDLDVQRLIGSMKLAERGTARGKEDQPSTQESSLDVVETEIIEVITAAQKHAHDELENQLTGFRSRLVELDFHARFSGIRDVAESGLADLKGEQQMGLDDLHGLRRTYLEAEKHLDAFRSKHRITRPGRINTGLSMTLKWLIIVCIFLFEVVTNAVFLSKGAELGLAGGVAQAMLFALLNVGVPLLIAIKGLPFLIHGNLFAKAWGLLWLGVFLVFTVGLNLGLAHYRELAGGSSLTEAGLLVMTHISSHLNADTWPQLFAFKDFESVVLFSLGVLFSTIALIDGFSIYDRYPGYQEATDNRLKAQDNYAQMRRDRIKDLLDIRQDYQDTVADLRGDLSKRRVEHEAIVSHRSRQLTLFKEHQNQLEKAGNTLLRAYRDANIAARTTAAPSTFSQPFKLQRIAVRIERENEWNTDDLKTAINEAQGHLEQVMSTLALHFDHALNSYNELDRLAPGS